MSQVFFTADTHFSHSGIIDMSARPFKSVGQMNSALVCAWNSVVGPRDTVWHLGDFAYGPVDEAHGIFKRLNGQKHLLRGNHDKSSIETWAWASVSDMKEIKLDGHRIFLCHYPLAEWPGYFRDSLHLFGHVHGNREVAGLACDVGVDVWGYRPVTLDEIKLRLKRAEKPEPVTVNDRIRGHARQMLEIADRQFEAWERSHLASAIEQTVIQVGNDILAQRTDQLGYVHVDALQPAMDPAGPRM
ncbi:MAG: metallophosphoesterase [Aurantimonas endophytica]|uniref:metallophosphoesterase n=1 Tax=Aurantimonas endophytica TaxID=1522175 RepID=UPI0030019E7D